MKRYDLDNDCDGESGECRAKLVPCRLGDYVLFDDAEALRLRAEKAEAERDALAARLAKRVTITPMPPFPISED